MQGKKCQRAGLDVTQNDVVAAAGRLKGLIQATPFIPSLSHPQVYLKAENLQRTGSFKLRPALNQLLLLSAAEKEKGIVTSSSGNFAQAVSYAAKLLGVSVKVVMMHSVSRVKAEKTRKWGAEVVFCKDRFEAREEEVSKIKTVEQRILIYPYDHPRAVAGNGTIALEILEQLPEVENIVVPISGGGLISGIAFTAKTAKPAVQVWGVQPQGSNATHLSFQVKKAVSIDRARTIADGLTVTRPGDFTFPMIQKYVDQIVVVQEETILEAMRQLLEEEKLVVEPAGAVPLAAVLEGKVPAAKTALVLSGGNVSSELLQRLLKSKPITGVVR